MKVPILNPDRQCDICHIGTRHEHRTSYVYWLDGTLIIMPGTATWVCDVCNDTIYDRDQIVRFGMLLGIQIDESREADRYSSAHSPARIPPSSGRRSV